MCVLTADRYRLLEVLGRSGLGDVWRAEDTSLGREVAVKLLLDRTRYPMRWNDSAGGVDRAQLNHPHVLLRVYDFGEDQDRCYLFMELVDNRSLRAALTERGGPLEGLRRYLDRSGAACPASAKAGGIEWS